MIKIIVKRCHHAICEIVIQNHAGYEEEGKDLVCAGVSCIAIGALNAIDLKCNNVCTLEMKDAYIRIKVNDLDQQNAQVMLDMLRIQLVTMQESYPKFIKITDQEV